MRMITRPNLRKGLLLVFIFIYGGIGQGSWAQSSPPVPTQILWEAREYIEIDQALNFFSHLQFVLKNDPAAIEAALKNVGNGSRIMGYQFNDIDPKSKELIKRFQAAKNKNNNPDLNEWFRSSYVSEKELEKKTLADVYLNILTKLGLPAEKIADKSAFRLNQTMIEQLINHEKMTVGYLLDLGYKQCPFYLFKNTWLHSLVGKTLLKMWNADYWVLDLAQSEKDSDHFDYTTNGKLIFENLNRFFFIVKMSQLPLTDDKYISYIRNVSFKEFTDKYFTIINKLFKGANENNESTYLPLLKISILTQWAAKGVDKIAGYYIQNYRFGETGPQVADISYIIMQESKKMVRKRKRSLQFALLTTNDCIRNKEFNVEITDVLELNLLPKTVTKVSLESEGAYRDNFVTKLTLKDNAAHQLAYVQPDQESTAVRKTYSQLTAAEKSKLEPDELSELETRENQAQKEKAEALVQLSSENAFLTYLSGGDLTVLQQLIGTVESQVTALGRYEKSNYQLYFDNLKMEIIATKKENYTPLQQQAYETLVIAADDFLRNSDSVPPMADYPFLNTLIAYTNQQKDKYVSAVNNFKALLVQRWEPVLTKQAAAQKDENAAWNALINRLNKSGRFIGTCSYSAAEVYDSDADLSIQGNNSFTLEGSITLSNGSAVSTTVSGTVARNVEKKALVFNSNKGVFYGNVGNYKCGGSYLTVTGTGSNSRISFEFRLD